MCVSTREKENENMISVSLFFFLCWRKIAIECVCCVHVRMDSQLGSIRQRHIYCAYVCGCVYVVALMQNIDLWQVHGAHVGKSVCIYACA